MAQLQQKANAEIHLMNSACLVLDQTQQGRQRVTKSSLFPGIFLNVYLNSIDSGIKVVSDIQGSECHSFLNDRKSVSEPYVPVCLMLSTQEGNLFD